MNCFHYFLINVLLANICDAYFPGSTIHNLAQNDIKRRNFRKRYAHPNLYLRHVICLGDDAEAVEAVCCTGSVPRPWLIILPTKRRVRCNQPDCSYICTSAIIASRYRSQSTVPSASYDDIAADYGDSFGKGNGFPNDSDILSLNILNTHNVSKSVNMNNGSNECSLSKDQCQQMLEVPKIILELLWLCGNTNESESTKSRELLTICNPKNISLGDFLNHLGIVTSLKKGIPMKSNPITTSSSCTEESDEDETDECSEDSFSTSHENSSEYVCSTNIKTTESKIFDNEFINLNTSKSLSSNSITKEYFKFERTNSTESNEDFTIVFSDYKYTSTPMRSTKPTKMFDVKEVPTVITSEKMQAPTIPMTKKTTLSMKTERLRPDESSSSISTHNTEPFTLTSLFRNPFRTFGLTFPIVANTKETASKETNDFYTDSFLDRVSGIPSDTTCCCQCSKKKQTELDKNKLKKVLMAVFSMPKPCQHPSLQPKEASVIPEAQIYIESYKPGGSVENYISYINNIYMRVYSEYKQAEWNYETNITYYSRQKAMEASLKLSQFQRDMKKALDSLHDVQIKDKQIERQIKLLYMPGMNILPDLQRSEFEQVLYAMQTIYTSAAVNKWKGGSEKVNLETGISQAMASSNNPDELVYYWSEWRNVTGKRIKPLFDQYVSLMDLTAKGNGFHDASEMWMSPYECEDFMDSLSGYWEEIKPLYTELHAYVRHRLHEYYGDVAGAKDSGKIPAHLTGDIWSKDWVKLYDKVFPYKEKNSFMDTILFKQNKKVIPRNMAKTAESLFLSLGFSRLPQKFWTNSIFERRNDTAMSCEPSAWDMYNGMDLRIKLCANSNLEDLYEIYHQMAICEYLKECNKQPFIFRDGANPAFQEGIAGAIVLSARSHTHIKNLKLSHRTPSKESEINDLVKLALEKVAFLPYSYIVDLWRHKVFRGEINSKNYNAKWWEFRSRYQGISPPLERTEDDFDAGAKLHIIANKPYIKYFVSTILEFQFHDALCRKANYHGPIHKCDFTVSSAAGKTVRKVMSMGMSNHWRVPMQEMTGVRRLNSMPLVQYFQPLYQWLKDKNKAEKITVGWNE